MERNKKIIIGAGIALGVIALGIGAYFAWQNRETIEEIISDRDEGVIQPFEPSEQRLRVISSREVAGYWIVHATSGPMIMYADPTGNILKIDPVGDELTYGQTLISVVGVRASGDGSVAFVEERGGGESIFNSFYPIAGLSGATIIGIEDVVWAPEGGGVAYLESIMDKLYVRTTQTPGAIGQSDGAKFSELARLPQDNFVLRWPQKDVLYIEQRPSAMYVSDIWRIDIKTKSISKFLSDRGLMVEWAPFGTRALKFTTTEGRVHKLALIDDQGTEQAVVRFVTLPDKCVMTSATQMYCAIPRDQGALAKLTLPDDYLKRGVYFEDGIYQIDIANNGIRAIYEGEEPTIDAIDLTVLDDRIVFVNRYDRKLYSLDLQ